MASRKGRYGSDSSASLQTPDITVQPRRRARLRSSLTSRDFPIPASPPSTTAPPSPRSADRRSSSSRDISSSRPTSFGETTRARATVRFLAARLLGFLRLAQSPAQRLAEPVRDLGMVAEELLETPFGHDDEDQIGAGDDVGAAALVIEQRQLAEVITRAELAVAAVAGGDLRLALDDDQETHPVLALNEDLRAFLVADLAHLLGELLQVAFGQALEQADRLELHRRDSIASEQMRQEPAQRLAAGRLDVRGHEGTHALGGELRERGRVLPRSRH